MVTEFIERRIAELEAEKARAVQQANTIHGAIVFAREVLAEIQQQQDREDREAVTQE